MKKKDLFILIPIIILIAVWGIIKYINDAKAPGQNMTMVVKVAGEVIFTKPYDENTEEVFEYKSEKGDVNVVEIKGSHINVIEASCPDQICVKTHAISHGGEAIVCLPHKFVVEVISDQESELDGAVK